MDASMFITEYVDITSLAGSAPNHAD